jgi:hypothetical protein
MVRFHPPPPNAWQYQPVPKYLIDPTSRKGQPNPVPPPVTLTGVSKQFWRRRVGVRLQVALGAERIAGVALAPDGPPASEFVPAGGPSSSRRRASNAATGGRSGRCHRRLRFQRYKLCPRADTPRASCISDLRSSRPRAHLHSAPRHWIAGLCPQMSLKRRMAPANNISSRLAGNSARHPCVVWA